MTNFSITIGYKAILSFNIKASSKEEAEKKALEFFDKNREHKNKKITIDNDSYQIDGILNMDNTWNLV